MMFAGASNPPPGWLYCRGQVLNRQRYADLFHVIGTTYGSTNNSDFKLPDYRDQFLRGNREGRSLGSVEESTLGNHVHGFGIGEWRNDAGLLKGPWAPSDPNNQKLFWCFGEGEWSAPDKPITDYLNKPDFPYRLVTDIGIPHNHQDLHPRNMSIEYIIYTGVF